MCSLAYKVLWLPLEEIASPKMYDGSDLFFMLELNKIVSFNHIGNRKKRCEIIFWKLTDAKKQQNKLCTQNCLPPLL